MTDDPTLTPNLTAYDERSLLGCALHDPGTARELLRLVKHPDWFADARLARAWSALRRALAGVGDDPVMLPDAVARELAGDGGDAPTLDELIAIAKDVGRMVGNAAYYAGRVRAAYVRRTAVGMLSETDLERNRDLATADLLAGVQERLVPIVRSVGVGVDGHHRRPLLYRHQGQSTAAIRARDLAPVAARLPVVPPGRPVPALLGTLRLGRGATAGTLAGSGFRLLRWRSACPVVRTVPLSRADLADVRAWYRPARNPGADRPAGRREIVGGALGTAADRRGAALVLRWSQPCRRRSDTGGSVDREGTGGGERAGRQHARRA